MLLTMKAPVGGERGRNIVRCNEVQAEILRKVGWTEVPDEVEALHAPIVTTVAAHYLAEEGMGSPPDQTLEPEPVVDPDEVRPQHERQGTSHDPDARGHEEVGRKKRTYHRRVVNVESDGKVNYSIKPPKRRYRRRDLTAED